MATVIEDTAKERVERGVKLLDKELPGWFNSIDLNSLALVSGRECVLGQCFAEPQTIPAWKAANYESPEAYIAAYEGSRVPVSADDTTCVAHYNLGVSILGLSEKESSLHGFLDGYADPTIDRDEIYEYDYDPDATSDGSFENLAKSINFVSFRTLEGLWRETIAERQKATVSA